MGSAHRIDHGRFCHHQRAEAFSHPMKASVLRPSRCQPSSPVRADTAQLSGAHSVAGSRRISAATASRGSSWPSSKPVTASLIGMLTPRLRAR